MKKNIGIITLPIGKSGAYHLANLIEVLTPITNNIILLTGNSGYELFKYNQRVVTSGKYYQSGKNPISRVIKYIYIQIWLSIQLIKKSWNVDIWIFYLGSNLILPKIVARALNKRIIDIYAGSPTLTMAAMNDSFLIPMEFLSKVNFRLSDKIVLYSPNVMTEYRMEKWHKKIEFTARHFVNLDIFNIIIEFGSRSNVIGYVGRLSEEKGILNFIRSIPEIIDREPTLKVVIIGEGVLQDKIIDYITEKKIGNFVSVTGWINQKDLPQYLNRMKILVVPSYTEGLPNVILESMACGTPVLASPVGSIPDIITDGENGYLMEDNSPAAISRNVVRALRDQQINAISANAQRYIVNNFSKKVATERIQKILEFPDK